MWLFIKKINMSIIFCLDYRIYIGLAFCFHFVTVFTITRLMKHFYFLQVTLALKHLDPLLIKESYM